MKFLRTLKEVFLTSLPLVAIIIIVCGVIAPMENAADYVKPTVGYIGVVFGLALFLIGLDVSLLPIGEMIGGSLNRLKKPAFIIFFGFLFGLLATVAEPALSVLARQANMIMPLVSTTVFIWVAGAGVGVLVGFSLFRVLKDINIKTIFAVLYVLLFGLIAATPEEFIALAFDGSGAATGDVSVPFILALGIGISATMSKNKSVDNSFGIVGLAAVGPIISLCAFGILLKIMNGGTIPSVELYNPGAEENLLGIFVSNTGEVALALFPVVICFLPFQFFLIKLPRGKFIRMLLGTAVVYLGLLIFLTSIDYGFAFAGKYIGEIFLDPSRSEGFKWLLLIVGFILGAAITLTEPAVTVLGEQFEEITNGHVKRMTLRGTLAVGIGFAGMIAMVKIITQINILWFLAPLYIVALVMMKYTSKLFVSVAFDSGGVAGGALTSAFLTPLTLGAAQAVAAATGTSDPSAGFGIIAFISVTPIIAVQALGIFYDRRLKRIQESSLANERLELEKLVSHTNQADDNE